MPNTETPAALVDIIEPAAPVVPVSSVWLVILLLVLGLALAYFAYRLWQYKWPAYKSILRLRAVQQKMQAGEMTPHEAVLRLALELRHGLAMKKLHAGQFPPGMKSRHQADWQEMLQQLDACLYQHDAEVDAAKISALFTLAETWLWRHGRRSTLKRMGD